MRRRNKTAEAPAQPSYKRRKVFHKPCDPRFSKKEKTPGKKPHPATGPGGKCPRSAATLVLFKVAKGPFPPDGKAPKQPEKGPPQNGIYIILLVIGVPAASKVKKERNAGTHHACGTKRLPLFEVTTMVHRQVRIKKNLFVSQLIRNRTPVFLFARFFAHGEGLKARAAKPINSRLVFSPRKSKKDKAFQGRRRQNTPEKGARVWFGKRVYCFLAGDEHLERPRA